MPIRFPPSTKRGQTFSDSSFRGPKTNLKSARSTVGQGVRDQLGPSWSQYGQVGPTWPSWSSFCCVLPSWKSTFDQLGPSWSSTLSCSIPCTPDNPKSRNTRVYANFFRKLRANVRLLPCDASQEPNRNCSGELVQMNFFILGGFFSGEFSPSHPSLSHPYLPAPPPPANTSRK